MLDIDIENLTTSGFVKWNDNVTCEEGVSHPKTLPDGTWYNICIAKGMHNSVKLVRQDPATPFTREVVATLNTSKMPWMHSFALTEDYAMIFEYPMYLDLMAMAAGDDMLHSFKLEADKTA